MRKFRSRGSFSAVMTAARVSPTAPARLPRGRHTLSREQVAGSQRARILRALADVMAEKGYARTSVADVTRAARVSRESFYEQFRSKEDCFMSAFEEAYGLLLGATAARSPGPGAAPLDRLDDVLEAYLDALAENPADARVFLIEVHAAGAGALARRTELQQGLVSALAAVAGTDDRFAVEAYVAAISALVTARLAAGDTDGLRALHEPLTAFARKVLT
ncbi:MAG: TetR/AcrR family transcriptional regulator [Solirubrobacterales bacterium]|nr:TetR/AcrR family transcriptional regulator [Solirubrobacterales bacterium]